MRRFAVGGGGDKFDELWIEADDVEDVGPRLGQRSADDFAAGKGFKCAILLDGLGAIKAQEQEKGQESE